ncbi:MAG: hypothetical protein CMJ67_10415 [Planctomycetaceae bacterium]|nr:hypothetical protein [Planctomycetaceae bacterium]
MLDHRSHTGLDVFLTALLGKSSQPLAVGLATFPLRSEGAFLALLRRILPTVHGPGEGAVSGCCDHLDRCGQLVVG